MKVFCIKCRTEIDYNRIHTHFDTKKCEKNKRNLFYEDFIDGNKCKKCCLEFKNISSLKNHIATKHLYIDNGWKPTGFCSESYQSYMKTEKYSEEQSLRMKEVVKNNKDSYSVNNVSGRVKTYTKTFFNKEYKFKGTWELLVAEKLFQEGIYFSNNIEPIEYIWNEDGKKHLYFPDFYIPSINMYIEVKGYMRKRDIDKWNSLDNLIIFKENEIKQLKTGIKISKLLKGHMS